MSDPVCLIVDDEPCIRSYVRAILERDHIQSVEAENAVQAMRMLQRFTGRLDLVVSDIRMPGDMSGIDLAYAIRNLFPTVPIILISGYADDAGVTRAGADFEFIPKPFAPAAILSAARRALDLGRAIGSPG